LTITTEGTKTHCVRYFQEFRRRIQLNSQLIGRIFSGIRSTF